MLPSLKTMELYMCPCCALLNITLALRILTGWQCKLISCEETSIEWHINNGKIIEN